jgi:hypothetical protein
MKRTMMAMVLGLILLAPQARADNKRMYTGALLGAGAGWVVSRNVHHFSPAYAIPVFAAAGGLIGNHFDNVADARQKREQTAEQAQAAKPAPTVDLQPGVDLIKVSIMNRNGIRTDVNVLRVGAQFVGPQGETYDQLPSAAVLAAKYGM